jgi:N-acetylmuramic acid 6-phosphate etherase
MPLPTTESRNPAAERVDAMTPSEFVQLMHREDAKALAAVERESASIARAIEIVADRLRSGGRLVYLGAGTSGRLGVLDASECPPTFNSPPEQVVGLIAGGYGALTRAVEGAEDHPEFAEQDLQRIAFSSRDVLMGIATSGRTPYVLGGIKYARRQDAFTIGLACNARSALAEIVDLMIAPVVGPEVISGSTRLKAGTATKLVLNMITTGAMIQLGKTYGDLMVDLRATNAKLEERTRRIVAQMTGLNEVEARAALERCGGELKTTVVAVRGNLSPDAARRLLADAGGHLRRALDATNIDQQHKAAGAQ